MRRNQMIILAIALAGLIAIGLYIRKDQSDIQRQSVQMTEDAKQLTKLSIEAEELRDKDADMLEKMEDEKYAQTSVMFRFEYLNRNLYDVIVPLMDEYGYTGNMTLDIGDVPGGENLISLEEFQILAAKGWDYSLEDSSAIKYSEEEGDNLSDAWISSVDEELQALDAAGIAVPGTFLCNMKETDFQVSDVLRERGFRMISMNDGNCHSLDPNLTMADFTTKAERLYTGDSIVLGTIDKASQNRYHVIVEIGQVIEKNTDENNVDIDKFRLFLDYLKEMETTNNIQIMTFSEFYEYEQGVNQKLTEMQADYDREKAEIDKRLAEIEKESAKIKTKRVESQN